MKRCAVELLQKGNYYEMTAFVSLFLLCLLVSNDSLVMSYNFFFVHFVKNHCVPCVDCVLVRFGSGSFILSHINFN